VAVVDFVELGKFGSDGGLFRGERRVACLEWFDYDTVDKLAPIGPG
jgi:hypothetical protein